MTHPLYWRDQELASWSATVLSSSPEGIVIDESAFFPGGGGQPPDAGQLEWGGVFTRNAGVSAAGLVPVPRDSGRRTGNLHRPQRYSRKLRRVFYLSASAAMMREGPNRDYYLKKRGQGHGHVQALIALSRRRVDVLWALLRDNRLFEIAPPTREPMARTA